jgi:hypothetical protein
LTQDSDLLNFLEQPRQTSSLPIFALFRKGVSFYLSFLSRNAPGP